VSRCEKAKVTILPGSHTIHIHVVNIHKLGPSDYRLRFTTWNRILRSFGWDAVISLSLHSNAVCQGLWENCYRSHRWHRKFMREYLIEDHDPETRALRPFSRNWNVVEIVKNVSEMPIMSIAREAPKFVRKNIFKCFEEFWIDMRFAIKIKINIGIGNIGIFKLVR